MTALKRNKIMDVAIRLCRYRRAKSIQIHAGMSEGDTPAEAMRWRDDMSEMEVAVLPWERPVAIPAGTCGHGAAT